VNYYERHLGDYARDTAHLSLVEHGVYTLLLDRYYATEQPIPADQCHRIARARTRDEKAAVDAVMAEFFVLIDGGYVNNRAEEEIARLHAWLESQRANGKKGGRPRKAKPNKNPTDTQTKPVGFDRDNPNETQTKAHQTPDTIKEAKSPNGDSSTAASLAADPKPAECPHEAIIAAYHRLLPSLIRVREWTPARQALLRARWREKAERQSLAWWEDYFGYVAQSDFLMGRIEGRNGPFECDLEWLIRPKNLVKVIEGKYENKAA